MRVRALASFALVLLVLSLSGCGARGPSALERRAHSFRSYAAFAGKALEDRLSVPPKVLVDYLAAQDGTGAYRAATPTPAEIGILRDYLAFLPSKVRAVMEEKVVGFFLVEGFKGGGLADEVFGSEGQVYSLVVLNPAVFTTSLNEWIAYRDASPFDDSLGFRLTNGLPTDYLGLLQVLLHEGLHVYDRAEGATPFLYPGQAKVNLGPEDKAFTKGVWTAYDLPAPEFAIEANRFARPYGLKPKVPSNMAFQAYAALAATPFSSLYGSQSWVEDFAESATWLWLERHLGITYRVSLTATGSEPLAFGPDRSRWSPGRRALVDAVLAP